MGHVVISGYYGFDNAGDEAILNSLIDEIRAFNENIDIYVLSANPQKTAENYSVKAVNRNSLKDIKNALKKASAFISGGGSLLQDVTSFKSIYYYLFLITLARKMGVKTFVYSNGIGPINNSFNKLMTKIILNKVDYISVRDTKSELLLKEIGVKQSINFTTDPAFLLKPYSKEYGFELMKKEGILIDSNKPTIGISVRPWSNNENKRRIIANAIEKFTKRENCNILFIPFHSKEDIAESEKIIDLIDRETYLLKGSYSPKEIMSVMSNTSFIFGIRLHALIFAATLCIPFQGISYDPKIDSFLDFFDLKPIGSYNDLELESLLNGFENAWDNKEEIQKLIASKNEDLKSISHENNQKVFGLI